MQSSSKWSVLRAKSRNQSLELVTSAKPARLRKEAKPKKVAPLKDLNSIFKLASFPYPSKIQTILWEAEEKQVVSDNLVLGNSLLEFGRDMSQVLQEQSAIFSEYVSSPEGLHKLRCRVRQIISDRNEAWFKYLREEHGRLEQAVVEQNEALVETVLFPVATLETKLAYRDLLARKAIKDLLIAQKELGNTAIPNLSECSIPTYDCPESPVSELLLPLFTAAKLPKAAVIASARCKASCLLHTKGPTSEEDVNLYHFANTLEVLQLDWKKYGTSTLNKLRLCKISPAEQSKLAERFVQTHHRTICNVVLNHLGQPRAVIEGKLQMVDALFASLLQVLAVDPHFSSAKPLN